MAFGKLKQNLPVGSWVKIGATGGGELDGMLGRIAGRSNIDISDVYIVLLTERLSYNDDVAVCLTEACLEPYDVQRGRVYSLRASVNGSDDQS